MLIPYKENDCNKDKEGEEIGSESMFDDMIIYNDKSKIDTKNNWDEIREDSSFYFK